MARKVLEHFLLDPGFSFPVPGSSLLIFHFILRLLPFSEHLASSISLYFRMVFSTLSMSPPFYLVFPPLSPREGLFALSFPRA